MSPITDNNENAVLSTRAPGDAGPAGPVIVIGHTGMLGQAILRVAAERGLRTIGISRRTVPVNLARQADLSPFLDRLAPSLVINAAADTDLARCEADPAAALEVNARLPGLLARWGRKSGVRWVQVSTDHYWHDIENSLHDERAPVSPPNAYARTKRAGEEQALSDPNCLVLRTNLVGFRGRPGEPTFVEWAIAALAAGEPFDGYTDVWSSPIDVHQFAQAMFELVPMGAAGLLNVAGRESVSKADFIAALADAAGYDVRPMRRVQRTGRHHPRRANALGLDVARAEALLGRALPNLAEVIEAILASPGMPRPSARMVFTHEADAAAPVSPRQPPTAAFGSEEGRPNVELA